jgi:hypothetical protein
MFTNIISYTVCVCILFFTELFSITVLAFGLYFGSIFEVINEAREIKGYANIRNANPQFRLVDTFALVHCCLFFLFYETIYRVIPLAIKLIFKNVKKTKENFFVFPKMMLLTQCQYIKGGGFLFREIALFGLYNACH